MYRGLLFTIASAILIVSCDGKRELYKDDPYFKYKEKCIEVINKVAEEDTFICETWTCGKINGNDPKVKINDIKLKFDTIYRYNEYLLLWTVFTAINDSCGCRIYNRNKNNVFLNGGEFFYAVFKYNNPDTLLYFYQPRFMYGHPLDISFESFYKQHILENTAGCIEKFDSDPLKTIYNDSCLLVLNSAKKKQELYERWVKSNELKVEEYRRRYNLK